MKDTRDSDKEGRAKSLAERRAKRQAHFDAILTYAAKHGKVGNWAVQELVEVSSVVAKEYLAELFKQGKLKRTGKQGEAVVYVPAS
ncbi:MAG TPA: hypothetical protein VI953_02750 [Candidatus Paceibacterota bacterium]